ncbi:hypothetical protein ACL02T_27660 [Pseudonocardia sp. RS010]|uniref:hypothetical protein n=1 Tax=Pseudonocardia sp. RS010 TaxID=3385979 RepID=UPI0039A0CB4C
MTGPFGPVVPVHVEPGVQSRGHRGDPVALDHDSGGEALAPHHQPPVRCSVIGCSPAGSVPSEQRLEALVQSDQALDDSRVVRRVGVVVRGVGVLRLPGGDDLLEVGVDLVEVVVRRLEGGLVDTAALRVEQAREPNQA